MLLVANQFNGKRQFTCGLELPRKANSKIASLPNTAQLKRVLGPATWSLGRLGPGSYALPMRAGGGKWKGVGERECDVGKSGGCCVARRLFQMYFEFRRVSQGYESVNQSCTFYTPKLQTRPCLGRRGLGGQDREDPHGLHGRDG